MDTPAKMEASAAAVAVPRRQDKSVPPEPRAGRRRRRPAPGGAGDPAAGDPFRLGFRERAVTTPDGRKVLEQIPLTPDDLLYPQEGDVVADGFPHNWLLIPLYDAMRRHLGKRPATLVTFSTVLVLGDGKNCSPDVAVIEGDVDLSAIRRAVKLRALGGQLVFALEAVSSSEKEIEDKDLEKNVERYAAEGVAEYLTVYPVVERRVKDLVGRRLSEQGEYEEIPPDAEGRVYSEQLDLYFSIDPESEELVAVDAATGQPLLTSDEEEARADRAEARAEQAEQRLRRNVEDLCGLLGVEWTAERSAAVAGMGLARLEALWADLMSQKRWP